jgi:moderate conductance mechanosensitive channel
MHVLFGGSTINRGSTVVCVCDHRPDESGMSSVYLVPSSPPPIATVTTTVLPGAVPTSGAAPTPSPSPSCLRDSDLCRFVFDHTHNSWLASSSYYLLIKPLRILLIIVIALILRWLIQRTIRKLVARTAEGQSPSSLKPLRLRLADATFRERRQQRAEAIGSVLMSFGTAAIFSIGFLMILGELGIQLAPLLASAGIVGLAIGFGAQTLVKDMIAGLFMLLEDQYGVGDIVDLGEASGTVEAVGLRTTSIRDGMGVLWHIRNGEVVRVGNKSQGWGVVVIDLPIGFARVDTATDALNAAAQEMAADPQWSEKMIGTPEVLGVEQLTVDGAILRTTVKASADAQASVTRELRNRLTAALAVAGVARTMSAGRVYLRPPTEGGPGDGTNGTDTGGTRA